MIEAPDTIQRIEKDAKAQLEAVQTAGDLEAWRVSYLGRKGAVPLFLRGVKDLPLDQRAHAGAAANALREELEAAFGRKQNELGGETTHEDPIGKYREGGEGHLHPLTLAIRRISNILSAMGFLIVEGPEVEEAQYNFDLLNIPLEHSARKEQDTFYLSSHPELVLRTHTSPVQVRAVLERNIVPPFRIASPGRVFRAERTDATHESTFHQFEVLSVGENVTIADFKGTVETFYSAYFQSDVTIRLRPSYFPFVEPGFEIDMSCVFCQQKGCRICKHTGWVEVMGAGMVHPNVLRNMNVNPEKYQGFAFGGAVDRLVMLQHGIYDIRLLWSGDFRFLKQFS
ncbi:MAG: phenylalanine--tRNA ligase subunit alpha [Candidatus Andersenbacteria bacterium]